MAREVKIRTATLLDTCAIYELLVKAFDEAPIEVPKPEMRAGLQWIAHVTDNMCYVAEVDGKLVGSLGIEYKTFPWAPEEKLMNDAWFYVLPDYRNSDVASALIKKIQLAVVATGVPFFGGVNWGGSRVELKDRFIKRHGFTFVGSNFAYGLKETAA